MHRFIERFDQTKRNHSSLKLRRRRLECGTLREVSRRQRFRIVHDTNLFDAGAQLLHSGLEEGFLCVIDRTDRKDFLDAGGLQKRGMLRLAVLLTDLAKGYLRRAGCSRRSSQGRHRSPF